MGISCDNELPKQPEPEITIVKMLRQPTREISQKVGEEKKMMTCLVFLTLQR